jgi:SAM-dependent methyltransferase
MHDTAAAFGAAFFRCYVDAVERARILEVGAGDVNGTLRACAPQGSKYTGVDLAAGPGVDLVLSDPYVYPFKSDIYDVVVSSSCMEHDQMFWLSFAEMCRVLRSGGFIYLNVPSNGAFHRYPTDNWRFYPDSGMALAAWGRRNGHDIHLVESFVGRRRQDVWNDCVLIFGKGDPPRPPVLLSELFPRSFNIRVGEQDAFANFCELTEDMTLRVWLAEKLGSSSPPSGAGNQILSIEGLITSLAEREVAFDAAERAVAERSAAAEAQFAALRAEREAALAASLSSLDERDAAVRRSEALRRTLDERAEAAGRQISERDTAIALLRNELAEMHGAGAAREVEIKKLKESVESLQRQTASLREELAAARQAGRSLPTALGSGSELAPNADRPVR